MSECNEVESLEMFQGKTYIQEDLLDAFPLFIEEQLEKTTNHIRVVVRDFSIISIIKLLSVTRDKEVRFSKLHLLCGIRNKARFLKHLHLCLDLKFIERRKEGDREDSPAFYKTTFEGRILLDLFKVKK